MVKWVRGGGGGGRGEENGVRCTVFVHEAVSGVSRGPQVFQLYYCHVIVLY